MKTRLPKTMRPQMTHIGDSSAKAIFSAMNELPHKAMATNKQPIAWARSLACCTLVSL